MRVLCPSRYDDLCQIFLASLEVSQPGSCAAVTILDNGISETMKKQWPLVRFLQVEREPFRYAKAINAGVREVAPEDTLILGDDMEMRTPRWLDVAARFLNRWPREYGSLNLLQNAQVQEEEVVESRLALGLGVTFIPRRVWERTGPWDERYDMGYGYEDWDYNMRLWHKGLKVGTTNILRVLHMGTETWQRKLGSRAAVIDRCLESHKIFYAKWGLPEPVTITNILAEPHLTHTCPCKGKIV